MLILFLIASKSKKIQIQQKTSVKNLCQHFKLLSQVKGKNREKKIDLAIQSIFSAHELP